MSDLPDRWLSEILGNFREPGDLRYQLIYDYGASLGIEPPPFEVETLLEGLPTGFIEISRKSMFGNTLLSMIGNGLWLLDGSCEPIFKNNEYRTVYSDNTWKSEIPATWLVVPLSYDLDLALMSDIPNYSKKISIVWDSKFGAYPYNFILEGINDLGVDENFEPIQEVVWQINCSDNDMVTSTIDISAFSDVEYSSLRITALDWSLWGNTFPTISGVYLGTSENGMFTDKQLINASKTSSIDVYSNSLSSQNISLEISTIGVQRDLETDMLLSDSLPENSRLYVQFGLTFRDKSTRYLPAENYSVSKYESPSDSQAIKIKGVSALESENNIFKYNAIAKGLNRDSENLDPYYEVDLPLYMIPAMMQPSMSTELNVYATFPEEISDPGLTTRTLGALRKGTPVNQALQYIAQLLQAILYTDLTTNQISCKKVSDTWLQDSRTIDQKSTIGYPAITREKNINKIDIKMYSADLSNWKVMHSGSLELFLTSTIMPVYIHLEDGKEFDYDERDTVSVRVWYTDEDDNTIDCPVKNVRAGYSSISFNLDVSSLHSAGDDSKTARFSVEIWGCENPPTFIDYEFVNDNLDPIEIEFEWDKPHRGVRVSFDDLDSFQPGTVVINEGAYYARVKFEPAKLHTAENPGRIYVQGIETKFTSQTINYWDNSKNEAGETLTIDNPLISNQVLFERVGSYIKDLISSRKRYKIDYLGDPAITALQLLTIYTDLEIINPFLITKSSLSYNGGYSGKLEGRTI